MIPTPPLQSAPNARRARGPYREPTTPVRVPRSLLATVNAMLTKHRKKMQAQATPSSPDSHTA